jgi:hypothetical protein
LIEITAIRLQIVNMLRPVLTGIKVTPEVFDGVIREVKNRKRGLALEVLEEFSRKRRHNPNTRGEVPSAPASVKALRPLRGAQDRAALTDASAPGSALVMRRMSSSHVSRNT